MTENKNTSNFWFGLIMGITFGAGGLYLIGTKNGRKKIKKLMELAEDMELHLEEVVDNVGYDLEKKEEGFKEKATEFIEKNDIKGIIEKITSIIPEKKETKKYFVKDGKIIK